MDALIAPLTDIEKAFETLKRNVLLEALRPGIDADRVRSLLGEFRLPVSSHLEELYAWHDGTGTTGVASLDDIHFFPGFYFLSLEDAVANYRAFVSDPRWMPGWLPIFANGGGDFYVTDLSGEPAGVVRHFRIEESEHPVEFLTIGSMLTTIAAGFEQTVFFVDGNGYLEMNDLDYAAVAARLNPGVPWWID